MKSYIAIGHFKESKNITCVADIANTKKDFQKDLKGNGFVAYVVITENKLKKLEELEGMDLFLEVRKMTTNYRIWNDVTDYIEQCLDIMKNKMVNA